MKNVEKLIDVGKKAAIKNPPIKLTKDEMNAVLKRNKGNIVHFATDLYYMGFALGCFAGMHSSKK